MLGGRKEVLDLLDDFSIKFNSSYKEGHTTENSQSYKQYFLGSFVLSNKNGVDYIIDGQQRLTTLGLLFLSIHHILSKKQQLIGNPSEFVYSDHYGSAKFNIDVQERLSIMQYLLNNEDLESSDQSIVQHRLFVNYRIIKEYLVNNFSDEKLKVFFYWLAERVLMVKITAYEDDDAYTIFESMNDRGKSLSDLEKLKGYLLSLTNDHERKTAISIWKEMDNNFIDEDQFDFFIKSLFKAKWAETTVQSSNIQNTKNDWSRINDQYHRFIKDKRNDDCPELRDSNEIFAFMKNMSYYAEVFLRIQDYKERYTEGFEDIYKLDKLGFPHLEVLIFGLLSPDDVSTDKKIKVISKFLIIRSALFSWNGQDMANDPNVSSYILSLLRRIRKLAEHEDINVIVWALYTEVCRNLESQRWKDFNPLNPPILDNRKHIKKGIFFLLASMSSYLDVIDHSADRFNEFYNNKYEIEHILAASYESNPNYFSSQEELDVYRDYIGALGLLPKPINGSFQALPYNKKIDNYTHNIMLLLLDPSQYKEDGTFRHHPRLNDLIKKNESLKGQFKSYSKFGRKEIFDRSNMMAILLKKVFDVNDLIKYADEELGTFDELNEWIDQSDKFEEDELRIEKVSSEYQIGDVLYFERYTANKSIKSSVTAEYRGKGRVVILKITNAPMKENYTSSGKKDYIKFFKRMCDEMIKNNASVNNGYYSWTGMSSEVSISLPLSLVYGRKMKENIAKKWEIKYNKNNQTTLVFSNAREDLFSF